MSSFASNIIHLNYAPSSLPGYDAAIGERAEDTTTGLFYVKSGTGVTDWILATTAYGGGSVVGSGEDGARGLQGDDGEDGLSLAGADGDPGAAGATGATGEDGPRGLQGEDGDDGLSIAGADGDPGATGAAGADGADGLDRFGLDGEDGDGLIGPPGADGTVITGLGFVHADNAGGTFTRQGNGFTSAAWDSLGGGLGTTLQSADSYVVCGPYTIPDGYTLTVPDGANFMVL